MDLWQKIVHLFDKPAADGGSLTEFEDSLMLIVDPEQLTSNLLSKLNELMDVERAFVYLADHGESPGSFSAVDKAGQSEPQLSSLTSNGLDPTIAQEFLDQLRRLRERGKAILMTTHDIFRAKMIADRVGIMKQGCLVAIRKREDFKHADLEQIYIREMESAEVVA